MTAREKLNALKGQVAFFSAQLSPADQVAARVLFAGLWGLFESIINELERSATDGNKGTDRRL